MVTHKISAINAESNNECKVNVDHEWWTSIIRGIYVGLE